MGLKNKLMNLGLGMVALSGIALSSCEKDNDKFEEMREAQIKEQKEKTLEQLSRRPYRRPKGVQEERIFFDKDDREVTVAETYKSMRGNPIVFKNQETYDIQKVNLDEDKVEVKGHPDIKIEGDCNVGSPHPKKVRNVQTKNECYRIGRNPPGRNVYNLEGEEIYIKKHMNSSYGPDTIEVSFQKAPKTGETYALMEGHKEVEGPTKGYSFEDNGHQSDYTTNIDINGDRKGDTLYMAMDPYVGEGFPPTIRLTEFNKNKEHGNFSTHWKYEKLN